MSREHDFIICRDKHGGEHQILKEALNFRIAVSGILVRNNLALLIRDRNTGKLELPGGGVEKGETLKHALEREFQEETGISVHSKQLLTYRESFFYMRNPNIAYQSLRLFFSVDLNGGSRMSDDSYVNMDRLTPRNTNELTYSVIRELYLEENR